MFSNDTINHHFVLTQTSEDWNIDPCAEGKHPLGWLQCGSVDWILSPWSFIFHLKLGLYHYCDEGVVLPSLFLLTRQQSPQYHRWLMTLQGWNCHQSATAKKKTMSTATLTFGWIAQSYLFVFLLTKLPHCSFEMLRQDCNSLHHLCLCVCLCVHHTPRLANE